MNITDKLEQITEYSHTDLLFDTFEYIKTYSNDEYAIVKFTIKFIKYNNLPLNIVIVIPYTWNKLKSILKTMVK